MKQKFQAHRFRRTTLTFSLCMAFLIGVGLAHTGKLIDSSWWWICSAPLLFTIWKRKIWALFWIILFGVSLGGCRGSFYMTNLADYGPYYNRTVTISAVA